MLRSVGIAVLLMMAALNVNAATELCEGKVFLPQLNNGKARFDGINYKIIKKGEGAAYSGAAADFDKSGTYFASAFLINDDKSKWIRIVHIAGVGELIGDNFSTTLVVSGFSGDRATVESPKVSIYKCESQ